MEEVVMETQPAVEAMGVVGMEVGAMGEAEVESRLAGVVMVGVESKLAEAEEEVVVVVVVGEENKQEGVVEAANKQGVAVAAAAARALEEEVVVIWE